MIDVERREVLAVAAGLSAAAIAGSAAAQEQRTPPSGASAIPTTSAAQEAGHAIDPLRPLAGRVALITGAARGIGRASALELARHGADVAVLDIADPDGVHGVTEYRMASREDLAEAERIVRSIGGRAISIVADIRDKPAMMEAASRITSDLGGIDIVVANAAVFRSADGIEGYDRDAFNGLMEVNVLGTVNTVQAMLPSLRARQGGRIIILGSLAGRSGQKMNVLYSASKWAVEGLMKSLALQLAPANITVNCIAPGPVDTPLHVRGRSAAEVGKANSADAVLPVSTLAPEDIAHAVAYLAGPAGVWVSGATIDVDAGRAAAKVS